MRRGRRYPCSLGRVSPITLAAFFLTYVAPCEFSSSSMSTLKDIVSAEGRCLLRLNNNVKEFLFVMYMKYNKTKQCKSFE